MQYPELYDKVKEALSDEAEIQKKIAELYESPPAWYSSISSDDLIMLQCATVEAIYDNYIIPQNRVDHKKYEAALALYKNDTNTLITAFEEDLNKLDEKTASKILNILDISYEHYKNAEVKTRRNLLLKRIAAVATVMAMFLVEISHLNFAIGATAISCLFSYKNSIGSLNKCAEHHEKLSEKVRERLG